jgi:hypothetical protein
MCLEEGLGTEGGRAGEGEEEEEAAVVEVALLVLAQVREAIDVRAESLFRRKNRRG